MREETTAQLVTGALVMAIWRRGKPDALQHNSDRGSEYTQFQRLIVDHGIICSMSRSGMLAYNMTHHQRVFRRSPRSRPDIRVPNNRQWYPVGKAGTNNLGYPSSSICAAARVRRKPPDGYGRNHIRKTPVNLHVACVSSLLPPPASRAQQQRSGLAHDCIGWAITVEEQGSGELSENCQILLRARRPRAMCGHDEDVWRCWPSG